MLKSIFKILIVKVLILYSKFRNYQMLICPWGIGDTLFVAMCIREYKRRNSKKVIIICKRYTKEICENFKSIDKILGSDCVCKAFNWYISTRNNRVSENYVYAHIDQINIEGYNSILQRYANKILGIKGDINYEYPSLQKNNLSVLNSIIDNNSIIIAPYAKSRLINLNMKFWEQIVNALLKKGFKIFTNCGNKNENEILGTNRLEISLNDLFICAEKCRAFVAFRSGICDWIALSDSNMYVINDPMWGKEWDLNNFSRNPVYYYQYDYYKQSNIIDKLIFDIEVRK